MKLKTKNKNIKELHGNWDMYKCNFHPARILYFIPPEPSNSDSKIVFWKPLLSLRNWISA